MRFILAFALVLCMSTVCHADLKLWLMNGKSVSYSQLMNAGSKVKVVTTKGEEKTFDKREVDFQKSLVSTAAAGVIFNIKKSGLIGIEKSSDTGPVGVVITNTGTHIGQEWKIDGKVKNETSENAIFVHVVADLFSKKGDYIASEEAYTTPEVLTPGQGGTFRITFAAYSGVAMDKTKFTVRYR